MTESRGMVNKATEIELEVRAKEIARRMLWHQPHTEIMRDLHLTKRQFDWVVKEYAPFKTLLESLQRELFDELDEKNRGELADVQSKARASSIKAIDKLIDLMSNAVSQDLQRQSANDIIKYSGTVRNESIVPAIQLNNMQINLLFEAISEDGKRRGNGHDVDAGSQLRLGEGRAESSSA